MINKIRENLYLCAADDVIASAVKERQINAILNVSLETTTGPFEGVEIVKAGFRDNPNYIHDGEKAVSVLKAWLTEGKTVLVHCRAGASRSPHVVAAALSQIENRDYEDVYKELCTLRSRVLKPSLREASGGSTDDWWLNLKTRLKSKS